MPNVITPNIVNLFATLATAPTPSQLQKSGALVSIGGTTLNVGDYAFCPDIDSLKTLLSNAGNATELLAMGKSFFSQGSAVGFFVLELGLIFDVTPGVLALNNWNEANPGVFYAYLVPELWGENVDTVGGVTLTNEGSGYAAIPNVTFSAPPTGVSATGVAVILNGRVIKVRLTNPGYGYVEKPTLTIAPPRVNTTATGTASISGGAVSGITMTNGGGVYPSVPPVTIAPPPPSVLPETTVSVSGGRVTSVSVDVQGTFYPAIPAVEFAAPPNKVLPEVSITMANGTINAMTVDVFGKYYLTAPTITIAAPPASVLPVLDLANVSSDGKIVSIDVATPGGLYFLVSPAITISPPSASIIPEATANLISDGVGSVTINVVGGFYGSVPTVTFDSPPSGGTTAKGVAIIVDGLLTAIAVDLPGSGYITPPGITIQGPDTPLTAQAEAVIVDGLLTGIAITDPGSGYGFIPNVTVEAPPTPVQARATALITGGILTLIAIDDRGRGYPTAPTFNIEAPPSPEVAEAVAVLTNGTLTGISLTNPGIGYPSSPTLSIDAPPSPINAEAVAILTNGVVSSSVLITAGMGYRSSPAVLFEAPPVADGATGETFLAASMATVANQYANPTGKTYFYITTTPETFMNFAGIKSAITLSQSPTATSTEFQTAMPFYQTLVNLPGASNKLLPMGNRYSFGLTKWARNTANNRTVIQMLSGYNNYIGDGAEGGLSNALLKNGTNMDGVQMSLWYGVDWFLINVAQALAAAVINGSNSQPPLLYNQTGINILQSVAQNVANAAVSFGCLLSAEISATPFAKYVAENPGDYTNGIYSGLSAQIVGQNGFLKLNFFVTVFTFVPTTTAAPQGIIGFKNEKITYKKGA